MVAAYIKNKKTKTKIKQSMLFVTGVFLTDIFRTGTDFPVFHVNVSHLSICSSTLLFVSADG